MLYQIETSLNCHAYKVREKATSHELITAQYMHQLKKSLVHHMGTYMHLYIMQAVVDKHHQEVQEQDNYCVDSGLRHFFWHFCGLRVRVRQREFFEQLDYVTSSDQCQYLSNHAPKNI